VAMVLASAAPESSGASAADAALEAFEWRWPWQKKKEADTGGSGGSSSGSGSGKWDLPSGMPSMDEVKAAFDSKREEVSSALQDALNEHHPRVKQAIQDAVDSKSDDLQGALVSGLSSLPDSMPLKQEMMKALEGASTDEIKAAIKEAVGKMSDSTAGLAGKTLDDLKEKSADWSEGGGGASAPSAQNVVLSLLAAPHTPSQAQATAAAGSSTPLRTALILVTGTLAFSALAVAAMILRARQPDAYDDYKSASLLHTEGPQSVHADTATSVVADRLARV